MNYEWISPQTIAVFVLVLARMSGIFVASPLLSNKVVPTFPKIALVLMMAALLFPHIAKPTLHLATVPNLIVLVLQEISIGVAIGFAAAVIFSALETAGEFIGTQCGYSIATIIDPTTSENQGVLTTVIVILGTLLFLYLNGHHLLLSALAKSFEALPLGKGFDTNVGYLIAKSVASIFAISIQMSAPFLVVLTLLNVIMGLLNKVSPQLNIYFNVGFIVSPIVGLILIVVTLPLLQVLMTQLTERMGPELFEFVRRLKGI